MTEFSMKNFMTRYMLTCVIFLYRNTFLMLQFVNFKIFKIPQEMNITFFKIHEHSQTIVFRTYKYFKRFFHTLETKTLIS